MASFAGLRGTGSWGTDERPKNFREMILWENPNGSAPLFALSAKIGKETVDDPEFSWWEERQGIVRLTVAFATGFATTDNTLTIASGGLQLVAGDVLQVEVATQGTSYSDELALVSSITSDTVIVIKRGVANTTAAPILQGANLTKIGSAFEEGSAAPGISLRNPTKLTNYCEIFKTSVGQTNTTMKTHARTGDAWLNDKKRKMFDHSRDIEFAWFFGKPYEDTSGTFPKRYTGGLRHFITTNRTVFTTTPTEDTLLEAIYPVWNYDSEAGDERICFAGNVFLNTLNKLARNSSSSQINFNGFVETYGMKLAEWVFPQGRLMIKTHPLLNRHSRYSASAFVIDPSNIKYRPLRDTFFKDNTQANDVDARQGVWTTEAGLEVQHEVTMAYLGNVTVP